MTVDHVRDHGLANQHARRQVVESANSALKGAFANVNRGFFRVMGLVKTTVLSASRLLRTTSTVFDRTKAKHGLDADGQAVDKPKPCRARRRSGVWSEIVESSQTPPPT